MKSKIKPFNAIAPLLIIAFLLLIGAKSNNAQETEDEREFDYAGKGEKGPRKWGQLKEEWAACSNGTLQSPIDMSNERVNIIFKQEKRNYKAANATIRNRGHDIQIHWQGDAGSVYINGTQYPLRYAHWHSPSEHTVHGRRYDMELHLVHLNTDPNIKHQIAVVGVLFKIGQPDTFLSKIMPNISLLIDRGNEERILGMLDPHEIKMHRKRFYRYMGSLTVPPCTEGVIWTLNKKVNTVSRDQVRLLREAVHDYAAENARPLQKLHNREIDLYSPGITN